MIYHIGDKVKGKVSGIQPYGVFVQLDDKTQGLIHISELKSGFVDDINEEVKLGEEIDVMVIDVDEYTKKISLSKRILDEKMHDAVRKYHPRYGNKKNKDGFQTIADNIPKSIIDTLEYLKQIKKQ